MQKRFELKVYWVDGAFKRTMKWTERMSDFFCASQINWGQGEVRIELNKAFDDSTYIQGDFVRVYLYSELYPTGLLMYTGYISRIERIYTNWIQKIILNCLGLSTLLNSIQYTAIKNQDPAQNIKDVVDYFNTKYAWNWLSYSGWFVEDYGSNINIQFVNKTLFEVVKETVEATNYWWYIDQWGEFHFRNWADPIIYTLTAWKDLDSITVTEDAEKITNRLIIDYNGWNLVVQDLISQATYWIKELYRDMPNLIWLSSATSFWNSYISENKDIKKKTSLTVNDNFRYAWPFFWDDSETWDDSKYWTEFWVSVWIEYFQPWNLIKVLNLDYSINNLQISKVDYNANYIKLELSDYDTFAKEILANN